MSTASAPTTVPCQYKTGRVLGQGTYAVVKEAIHISNGKHYACKVMNKRLMAGREHMIRNEIAVLKRISQGHPHIVTLYDFFETVNNLYLVTDLCVGGELFDQICARGSFDERDAAKLIQVITSAVAYLHSQGIVHRDLKPENLLFRDKSDNADLMIADFGLSKMIPEETYTTLSTVCGTPGYMAPEVFLKTGHGKPVDIWAIGVITYFLLSGYTPFDRGGNQNLEIRAICKADYSFEPADIWAPISQEAKDFIRTCLNLDKDARPSADELLKHPWISTLLHEENPLPDLGHGIRKNFNARATLRKAMLTVRAATKLQHAHLSPEQSSFVNRIEEDKKLAIDENVNSEEHSNEASPETAT